MAMFWRHLPGRPSYHVFETRDSDRPLCGLRTSGWTEAINDHTPRTEQPTEHRSRFKCTHCWKAEAARERRIARLAAREIKSRLQSQERPNAAPSGPTEFVYDDEYDGPRWRYGMCFRPPASRHQPEGRIIGADKKVRVDGYPMVNFGTIEYPRELTEQEIAAYELVDLGKVVNDAEA